MATYNPGSAFTKGSGYGYRTNPITGARSQFHGGDDYSAPTGTPVPAAADGKVYKVYADGELSGYGNCIVIEHEIGGEKVYTLYAHLESKPTLNLGDSVSQGQDVGNVGSTGMSTGPHLHFEVIPGNQPNPLGKGHDTYNPKRYDFPGGGSDGTGLSDPMYPPGGTSPSGPSGGTGRTRDPDAWKDYFGKAQDVVANTPIVLDLDGGGIQTTAVNSYGAHFDLDANGFAEAVGWVAPGEGLLVRDLDNDGVIDDGRELFGGHVRLPSGQVEAKGFAGRPVGRACASGHCVYAPPIRLAPLPEAARCASV